MDEENQNNSIFPQGGVVLDDSQLSSGGQTGKKNQDIPVRKDNTNVVPKETVNETQRNEENPLIPTGVAVLLIIVT